MRDVAALAGVGIKTVSRVVNGVPTVAPELATRVRSAADKLGYRPNLTAANLRRSGGRTNTIGLLLEDVSNPFSAAVLRAVEDHARARNVLVLVASLDEDPQREREFTRALIDRRVDGLIIMSASSDHRYVLAEQQAGMSFVFIDRLPSMPLADAIVSDNRGGARTAVAHLLATRRHRLAYLGDNLAIPTAHDRYQGFRDAVAGADLDPDDRLIRHGLRTADQARRAAHELLDGNPPQAIFTSQNLVTLGVVEALHERHLQHEVAVVGFDDIPLAAVVRPGITVLAQDPAAVGNQAVTCLFRRLDGDRSPPAVHTVPTRLIPRGSGELPLPDRATRSG
jgi:LacI family transcriptional regulator